MKFVYLILAHKYPTYLKNLVESLVIENNYFIIHLDAKEAIQPFLNQFDDLCNGKIFFVPKRHPVLWGRFSMIEATLSMINFSFQLGIKADYYHLISGQDYPIKSNKEINQFFNVNNGMSFLEYFSLPSEKWPLNDNGTKRYRFKWYLNKEGTSNYSDLKMKNQLFTENSLPYDIKPYGGSQWWSLHHVCIKYLHEVCNINNPLFRFYMYSLIPDEMMFHTILLNSKLKNTIKNDNLRLIKWKKINSGHPETLTLQNQPEILKCNKLFARKFDPIVNHSIINHVENARNNGEVKKPTKQNAYPSLGNCCIISTVGKKSLHKKWREGNVNFDLHLIVYDNSYEKFKNDTPYIFQAKGQKFKLLYKYLSENKELINMYDYFYFPDDDTDIDTDNINKLFWHMKEYSLDIAQPAVYNINCAFIHTLKHRFSIIRYTNVVENKQPCFSRFALKEILFTFNENSSGWGINYHWGKIIDYTKFKIAIIDNVKSIYTNAIKSNYINDEENYLEKYNLSNKIYHNINCKMLYF